MSTLSRFKLKRLSKRTSRYQLSVLCISLIVGWLLIGVMIPNAYQAWMRFGPRTPLGMAERVPVLISMDHLSSRAQAMLTSRPTSIVAHQVHPRLKLVGVGQSVIKRNGGRASGDTIFELGLLPQNAEELLKSDTQMSLRIQAPSVELLVQDLMRSPRGRALKVSLRSTQARLIKSWSALLPMIKEKLKRYLSADELERIMRDEVVISHLREAFMVEIGERVNIEQLGDKIGESQAVAELGQLAMKHVNLFGVIREAIGDGVTQLKAEVKQASHEAGHSWSRGLIAFDIGLCALKMSTSAVLPRWTTNTLGKSSLCKRVYQAPERVLAEGAKGGAINLFKQTLESLRVESPQVLKQGSKLALEIKEVTQAPVLLEHFWEALNRDEVLVAHLRETYGENLLLKFQLALRELSATQEVSQRLDLLKDEVRRVAREGFKALVLDREGKGPNPLLLAVIQEQLSGQARPIIHIIPGTGESVKPGYLFISRRDLISPQDEQHDTSEQRALGDRR